MTPPMPASPRCVPSPATTLDHSSWHRLGQQNAAVTPLLDELRQDEIEVWMVALPAPSHLDGSLASLLSPQERVRTERFVAPAKRREFLACRSALRILLGRYLGMPAHAVQIVDCAHGKPALAKHQAVLRFNLSHTDGLMLAAITAGMEVGIDVERLRTIEGASRMAAHYFTEQERAEAGDGPNGFLRLWTTRESALKAAGTGISAGWDTIRIADRNPAEADAFGLGHDCHIRRFTPQAGHVAAVAALRSNFHLRPIRTLDLHAVLA